MKQLAGTLSRRQKIALAGLLIANLAVLAMAVLIVRTSASLAAPPPAPIPTPDCAVTTAQLLAHYNVAGTARLGPDNVLHIYLTGQDLSGYPLPRASDTAWDALAAVLALPRLGCGPYPRVEVDVPAPDKQPAARLLVSADWVDLRAWGYGELDDAELAERLKTTLYTQPPVSPAPPPPQSPSQGG